MTFLHREVYGMPGAQGSKRHVGGGRLVESSKRVAPWRDDVRAAFLGTEVCGIHCAGFDEGRCTCDDPERDAPITGPLVASITFWFARPKSHFHTGKKLEALLPSLRPTAPEFPTGRNLGDVDKLLRSTFDAIVSAGVVGDDSQFVKVLAQKRWSDQRTAVRKAPGATITLFAPDHPGIGGQW